MKNCCSFKLLLAILFGLLGSATSRAETPNVLLIFVDDLGWTDLGCYGSTFHDTPNIDALAASGTQFTNGYSASPVCSPTRAALMTGKAPQRVGITQWIPQPSPIHLPDSELTIAESFKDAGYHTAYMGKWHLGEKDDQMPDHHGFDVMKGVNRGGSPGSYYFPYKRRQKDGIRYWDVPDFAEGTKGDYLTDKLTDKAIEFIKAPRDKPFFLCLAHYAVHTPIQPPNDSEPFYKSKRQELFGKEVTPTRTEKYNSVSRGRQDNARYAAMVKNLDENTGRLLAELRESGLEENTIVVFTSDNGGLCTKVRNEGPTCNLPLRAGKGWTYEGGIRIPAIISWKGKITPTKTNVPMVTMDIYPTLLELAGLSLKPKQHLDGLSLKSAIEAQPGQRLSDRFLAWSYPHDHGSGHQPSAAILEGPWKLIATQKDNSKELYNLEADLGEHENVVERHPERAKQLTEQLEAWLKETNQAN